MFFAKVPRYIKEQKIQQLFQLMNKEKVNRIRRYKKRDQYRSVLGEMIVRMYVKNHANVSDMLFKQNEYGKPFLEGVEFNISHSSDWVVCAISTYEIGIDIEKKVNLDIDIINHFFHPAEINWINKGTDGERLNRFYYLWTKKESFIKSVGKGLYMDLYSFVIRQEEEKFEVYIEGKKNKAQLIDIPYIDGYDCSCCILTTKPVELSVTEVDTNELMENMSRRMK